MSTIYTLTLTASPSGEDFQVVDKGLIAFNLRHAPEDGYKPLAVFVRDVNNQVVGGLIGNTYWGWLYIGTLWLADEVRGQHLGQQAMRMAEDEARQRDCRHVHVDTLDFQALPFYQKLGYSVWGQLDDLPPGHVRYFLKKDL